MCGCNENSVAEIRISRGARKEKFTAYGQAQGVIDLKKIN